MDLTPRAGISLLSVATFALCGSASATLSDYQKAITNETSLISYYSFDRTNASDNFGSNNGIAQGTAKFSDGIGGVGRGVLLDGAGRIGLGQVPDFDFSDGTGSVEAWVRPGWSGTFSAYNPCIFADRDGGPVTWSVHMNGDKSGVGVWNGSSYLPIAIPPPGTNWHHLAVTFDNSSAISLVTIYWDGVAVGDRNQDLGIGSHPTQLGSSAASVTDEGWVGSLDEVAFYADALSAAAIQSHYQAMFIGTPPVITRQPTGGTFLPGVNLQLSVGATGPNLKYQWFKNGNALLGATDAVLTFGSLAATNAATYHVVVSNPATNITSSDAIVALGNAIPAQLAAYQSAITNEPSLLSYYTFDRLTAGDTKGSHNGTLQGTAYFGQGVAGGPDQGLLLDGAGNVGLGTVPDFDFSDGTGSVEAWVRADWSSIAYNPCVFADRDGSSVAWSIHMNSDKKAIGMWNGTAYQTLALPDAGTNWHHLAVVFDTGNFTAYWDGVSLGTVTQALGAASATVQLGSSSASSTAEGWVGVLDEAAFYSDALSAAAVQAHYKAFLGATPPTITVQPVGGDFYPGRALQLSVWATGAGVSYQWFKNGNPITAATNWFLGFVALAASDAGTYYASAFNSAGTNSSSAVVLQVGNNLARYQSAVKSEPSLISYYTFDAGDATDTNGTNNGDVVGTAAFGPGVGQSTDKSLLLDGSGDIDLGSVPDFEFTNGTGTVEAWIQPGWSNDPGYDPCLFADRSGGPTDWSIHMLRTRAGIGNWNGSHFQSLGLGDTGGWHHYAVAFDSGQVSMYWDGALLGTFAQPINLSVGLSSQIGSSAPSSTAEGWIGSIDEVAFYRSALGAGAVHNHFLSMIGASTAPALSISRSGNQITLSWPPDAAGFALQFANNLATGSWTPIPGLVTNSVTLTITNDSQFYRLKK